MNIVDSLLLYLLLLPWCVVAGLVHFYSKRKNVKVDKFEKQLQELALESKRVDLEIKKAKLQKADLDTELKLHKLSKQNIRTKDISCNEVFY